MPKGKYTRKQASLLAYLEATGEQLPLDITFETIKKQVAAFPEELRDHCRWLYREYMSLGRPEYIGNKKRKNNR